MHSSAPSGTHLPWDTQSFLLMGRASPMFYPTLQGSLSRRRPLGRTRPPQNTCSEFHRLPEQCSLLQLSQLSLGTGFAPISGDSMVTPRWVKGSREVSQDLYYESLWLKPQLSGRSAARGLFPCPIL